MDRERNSVFLLIAEKSEGLESCRWEMEQILVCIVKHRVTREKGEMALALSHICTPPIRYLPHLQNSQFLPGLAFVWGAYSCEGCFSRVLGKY